MVWTRDLPLRPPRQLSRARCGRLAWVGPAAWHGRRGVRVAAPLALPVSWSLPALAQPATAAGAGHEGWLWPTLLLGMLVLLVLLALACLMLLQRQRQLVQALTASQATPTALANEPAALAADEVVDVEALATAETEAAASHEHESFSYTVSHDLRAPIRVVEGFTKILKEDYGRVLDRIGNDHLDRVLGAAARMNSMIDALLALSQLSSQPLARQPVDLSQLAAYVAEDLRRQSPEREVLLQIDPEMQVTGDPTLLRVVVENLLGNAWKYTGKCTKAEIRFARHPRDRHTFTVADNGAGFDMRFADRLFGVFQRLHSASEYQGTGVGLASVRRIVRRHGGEIWAESEVNQGARFHFSVGR
jgi:signal transduction histidine kinase